MVPDTKPLPLVPGARLLPHPPLVHGTRPLVLVPVARPLPHPPSGARHKASPSGALRKASPSSPSGTRHKASPSGARRKASPTDLRHKASLRCPTKGLCFGCPEQCLSLRFPALPPLPPICSFFPVKWVNSFSQPHKGLAR